MTEKTKAPRLKTIAAPTGVFPVEVTVQGLDGSKGVITFSCIARTQTAWSRERGDLFAQASARQKAREAKEKEAAPAEAKEGEAPAPEPEFDPAKLAKMVSERLNGDADMVQRIAKGWDLDDDFAPASFAAMEDAYPGAITGLVNEYSKQIHGNRLGN